MKVKHHFILNDFLGLTYKRILEFPYRQAISLKSHPLQINSNTLHPQSRHEQNLASDRILRVGRA